MLRPQPLPPLPDETAHIARRPGWLAQPPAIHGRLRRALIGVVQPAQHREGTHSPADLRLRRSSRRAIGEALLQSLVWPHAVEVGHVLAQHAPDVRLAQDQPTVRALASDTAEEPLAGGVLPGGTVGGPQHGDAARLGDPGEGVAIFAVVVADEVPGPLPEGRRLAELLGNPSVGRVPRHADMDDPARG